MAVSSCHKVFSSASFECRSDPDFSAPPPRFENLRRRSRLETASFGSLSLSPSLIFRFPPNFQRQLSTKARRNCSNIGVAQIVAASWANPTAGSPASPAPSAVDAAAPAAPLSVAPAEIVGDEDVVVVAAAEEEEEQGGDGIGPVQFKGSVDTSSYSSFLKTDASKTIHAGTLSFFF